MKTIPAPSGTNITEPAAFPSFDNLTHNNATDAATGPVDIPWPHLALSAVPLLVVALLSVRLQLELHHKLVIAILRCFGQLSALGWVLVPIFKADSWWLTMLYGALMVVVASFEAISRPQHTFHRALFFVVLILGTVAAVTVWFGLFLVVGVSPWYDPQYMIPILGMVLGNSCSGISVGLTSILNEFVTGRDHIELLLSFGATRMEATRECTHRAIQLSMTPLINAMNVVGVVSIPGMMTGQILGGSDPWVAAKYQVAIFQLIGASASVSSILLVFLVGIVLFDGQARLGHRPLKRKGFKDWWQAVNARRQRSDDSRNRDARAPLLGDDAS